MRPFGKSDHTEAGLTFHTRFVVFGHAYVGGRMIWVRDTSGVSGDLSCLIGSLPNCWMEMPLGKSPLRFIADMRHQNRLRVAYDNIEHRRPL